VEKPLKFVLSTGSVAFNKNVTVTWAIPEDQATHMDWIGAWGEGLLVSGMWGCGLVEHNFLYWCVSSALEGVILWVWSFLSDSSS
jgi:hypothetical protein